MCRELDIEHRLSVVIAHKAVAEEHYLWLCLLCRFQLFTRQEVAKCVHLSIHYYAQANSIVIEILHNHGLIVIGEQCYLRRSFDIGSYILAHSTADDIQCWCRIVIEVAEIIRNGQHKEHTF